MCYAHGDATVIMWSNAVTGQADAPGDIDDDARPRRQYVHELAQKLKFLTEFWSISETDARLGAGVPKTAFTRALRTGNDWQGDEAGDSRLGPKHQGRLAEYFGFPAITTTVDGELVEAWPEWRDPAAPDDGTRGDTAKEFMERYRAHIKALRIPPPAAKSQEQTVHTSDTASTQPTGVVRLAPGLVQPVTPLTRTIKLASVSIEGQQWGDGTVSLYLTLACNRWRGMTVLRGQIHIKPTPGKMTKLSYKDWPQPKTAMGHGFGRKTQVVITGGGSPYDPHLEITGLDGPIGTIALEPDLPGFEGLSPGDEVIVTFGTWLADVDTDSGSSTATSEDPFGSDGLGLLDKDGNVIVQPSETLTAHQHRAIALIRQETQFDAGPDGYVDLSTHTLRIGKAE